MIIVGNWKAYVEKKETAKKLFAVAKRMADKTRVKVIIAPSAPHLGFVVSEKRMKVGISAQDVSDTTVSAATGEVSATTLKRMGVSYVIIGHSERRARGESDALIASKVQCALASGLTPIVCVGESVRDKDALYLSTLRSQIDAVFAPLSPKDRASVIVAYEPVWAIGKSAAEAITPVELSEMVLYIRKVLSNYSIGKGSGKATIIYGGSVDPSNIRALAKESNVDGFLPGRASTDPAVFSELIKAVS
jgi:triosephosphate isomerase